MDRPPAASDVRPDAVLAAFASNEDALAWARARFAERGDGEVDVVGLPDHLPIDEYGPYPTGDVLRTRPEQDRGASGETGEPSRKPATGPGGS